MDDIEELLSPFSSRIGGNNPPDPIAELRSRLQESNETLTARRDELLTALDRAPEVTDEETCGKVADYIKSISACTKAAEGARVAAKEPYLATGRAVDGFFKQITDPLEKLKVTVQARITKYQRDKAEAERRLREEDARRAREEAERLRREADEAALKIATARELDQAIEVDQRARQSADDAEAAHRAAAVTAAELSRSRGDYGAVASLRTDWTFADVDRAELDLEELRMHLPMDGIERAIRSLIRAGGRELRGCRIFETHVSQVR